MALGSMNILAILILLIYEHGISAFICNFNFSLFLSFWCRSFISLVKFIPKYFILFSDAIIMRLFYLFLFQIIPCSRNVFNVMSLHPAISLDLKGFFLLLENKSFSLKVYITLLVYIKHGLFSLVSDEKCF